MAKDLYYDSLEYYKILKLTASSTEEEIKQNYRELAKFWHPDHNTAPNAVDIFQKLSVAYDVLKEEKTRLKYNLLSLIYNSSNFPEMNSLLILRNMHGQEDINLRAFHLVEITGKGVGHSLIDKVYYCSQYEAANVVGNITKHNWTKGFLGLTAIFVNIKALIQNIIRINGKKENFMLLLHNSLAYRDENKQEEALTLAILARDYAPKDALIFLDKYINSFENVSPLGVKKWNFRKLKTLQLFYPAALFLAIMLGTGFFYLNEMKQNNYSAQVKQVVTFMDGSQTFSDLAVAKIFDIPVDVYSKNELYHTTKSVEARHGADKEFDVFKIVEQNETVRITGYTVDRKWFRVMFNNGEMAFIEAEYLVSGIGKEIPLWSKIYKE